MRWAAAWPWAALALPGVDHGVNHAMGWVFACGRGLQERRRSAVLGALLPIALGHEVSIVLVVVAVVVTQAFVAPHTLLLAARFVLVAFGVWTLVRRPSHPRGFGMRVGALGLAAWSFLMSSAPGAGLMVGPGVLGPPGA